MRRAFVIFLIIAALGAISYYRLLDNYELTSLDFRFVLRQPKIPTSDKIVFIEIGEDSLQKLGRFPFDRSYHAILIKALSDAKARIILMDLLFSEPHEHDKELEFALNQAGNVYLPYVFEIDKSAPGLEGPVTADGYIARPLDYLAKEARGTGYINIVPDPDGKFRKAPLFIKYEGALYPHISLALACDYLGLRMGDLKPPLDEKMNLQVNFSGKWGYSYRHYSFADVAQSYLAKFSGDRPILNLADFKDKICIVGLTASGAGDVHPTPFEPICPGMAVHAEIINSILNNNFIRRASRWMNLSLLVIMGLLISVFTLKTKPTRALFALASILVVFVAAAFLLFNYLGLWIDVACPVLVGILLYLALNIYRYVVEWKKRLVVENELGIAKKIQESFLPKSAPVVEGAEIAVSMFTARQVGGDLYDFVEFPDSRFGIMIGDVSGKGVPAALFMAMTTGAFKTFAKTAGLSVRDCLARLNEKIVAESSSNLFVTVFYGIFDMKEKSFVYSNGGHLPVAHTGADGSVKFLDVDEGAPLGLMEGPYGEGRVSFKTGDSFVFYTDGITEAMNPKKEMYGSQRLEKVILKSRTLPAGEILKAIEKDVRKFEPAAKQHDDMTLIIVKV
jgi:CHASE2 domain-containing sensor protein